MLSASSLRRAAFSARSAGIIRSRLASTLAVIEHADSNVAAGSLSAISAAKELAGSDPVTAIIAGSNAAKVAESLGKVPGISKILVASNSAYDKGLPENLAQLLAENVKKNGFSHVVAASSAFGKNVIPRVGALLDVQPITDIIKIESEDTFVRPIYAGNAIATTKSNDQIKLVTIRTSAFAAAETEGGSGAAVEDAVDPNSESLSEWISEELTKSERPDLGVASKIVSGGRGLKDKENFDKVIYPFADAIGAAVGASRAAVDSGFADNSLQVGQTGKVVAPELYIAVGISGAIQHLAGMKDSKTIVAINKDPEAPIFQVADLGLVADLFEAVPELTTKLG
ncbi:Aim45p [Sugiyamaella lignohabitans]|uniref:Probable electron transfer flavoprotein subunit alpha n=1 Tax=Sugiyamaella lignohabitans TaxID=796027 RepID=A0A161HMN8_9ASCO|nr:Aim45p [Sugiyamaella lignohabitans]ANB15097.1 Aim45p [Sugiyamaella lignohabitans]